MLKYLKMHFLYVYKTNCDDKYTLNNTQNTQYITCHFIFCRLAN